MKTTVIISARREPTLLPRVVRILYWQGVFPERLHVDVVGDEHVQLLVHLRCDEWRLRRLIAHWEKVVAVESVVRLPASEDEAPPPAAELLCPVAR